LLFSSFSLSETKSKPKGSSNHMAEPYTHYIGDHAITTRDDVLPFLQNMYEIGKPGPFCLSFNMRCMVCKSEPARIDLNATQDVTSIAKISTISGPHVDPADRMWPAPYERKSRVNLCIECAGSWMGCFNFYGAKGSSLKDEIRKGKALMADMMRGGV